MNLMILPLWAWIVFYVLVLLMLVADLKIGGNGLHRFLKIRPSEVNYTTTNFTNYSYFLHIPAKITKFAS